MFDGLFKSFQLDCVDNSTRRWYRDDSSVNVHLAIYSVTKLSGVSVIINSLSYSHAV